MQELLLLRGPKKKKDAEFTQLEPLLQDCAGYIYFRPRNLLVEGVVKSKLSWVEVGSNDLDFYCR